VIVIALLLLALTQPQMQSTHHRIGVDDWTITVVGNRQDDNGIDFVFTRNGEHVMTFLATDLGTPYAVATRCWYPTPWPVFVVSAHSQAGHGLTTHFYAARNGVLEKILELEGEKGGPVFRDLDEDGTMEWLFDDFEWYRDDMGPNNYLVYRVNERGTLDLWKTLPNPRHKTLPMPWYRREWNFEQF